MRIKNEKIKGIETMVEPMTLIKLPLNLLRYFEQTL